FMIDITDRKRAEEALKDLGGRLITAQEEERSRIARELHDDLNQRMALLSIELEQIQQEVGKPAILRRRVHALQMQAQEIAADIHRLSYKLHPSKLDHLGLGAAVTSLCEELSKAGKLNVDLRLKGFPADLPRDLTLSVFRVVQESLRNSVKHSGAQAAQVVLEKSNRAVRLSVSDNGCGFDEKSASLSQGLGFISMRERIRFVGGEMHVYSQPERGTRIEVSVPLPRDADSIDG
ncbi:MAG TPA: sensor histidine kinase, partial [Pyrinomonadaceae bacterium]|nr:sensor histidine kinase [Pyrinomonadaceae bacterium]